MAEFNQNVWAPWRMEYIRSLAGSNVPKEEGCFLCRYAANPDYDAENHVIWRTPRTMVLLNRFPYTNGHLLIAPLAHKALLPELEPVELYESVTMLRDALSALKTVVNAQGFNIGMNVGQCAGAGLPDHLHWHIVPRWSGDTNFMNVIGESRVIPDSLDANYRALRDWSEAHGFPQPINTTPDAS